MVTVQTGKNKGSSFEYDCHESVLQAYPDVILTKQRGFQLMYDLESKQGKFIGECKRLKGISWNQAVKFYEKLESFAEKGYASYLFFQSNHQPCLVMTRESDGYLQVVQFEVEFGVPFIKHAPVKRNRIK